MKFGLVSVFLVAAASGLLAQTNQSVYSEALNNSWESWGWTQIDFNSSAVTHTGSKAISVTITQQWQAIYLHHAPQNAGAFSNLQFCINGGPTGGQQLLVQAHLNGAAQAAINLPTLPANTWTQINLTMEALGIAGQADFDGFWIQDRVGSAKPVFYLDDIVLIGGTPPPPVTNTTVTIAVNAASNRHAISPLIYGVAFATSNQLRELNAPLNRSGGNPESRYDWKANAHNRAFDFYFESIGDSPATAGAGGDEHVQASRLGGADAMLTIPMLGWMPKLGANRAKLASFSIAKYGPQTDNDAAYFPDAGNGLSATNGGREITWNDPNDANFPTNSLHQLAWLQHLTNRWGTAANGGVRYYCMDNEWSIWHSTHRDVLKTGASMRMVRDRFFDYAAHVKNIDPGALVAAPEEWGWSGYFYSGYDQQWSGRNGIYNPAQFPDRGTNGGWDYLPWFLDQVRQHDVANGRRSLDVFTVHFYPQSGEYGTNASPSMQALRNRSTRSLWDTNYTDASWISAKVQLIPRLKQWVTNYYPGTQIGLTEYNWGAEQHMNGATAQADLFGIFGRESLDVATRWTTPATNTPTYKAMKLYRNYDNANSGFGNISVHAAAPNVDIVAAFAAERSTDGALTVVAVNKTNAVTPAVLALTNFASAGSAQVWMLETNAITRRADVAITANSITTSLPAQSVTLFVISRASAPRLQANQWTSTNTLSATLLSIPGTPVVIEAATNVLSTNWTSVLSITPASSNVPLVLPGAATQRFFRARQSP